MEIKKIFTDAIAKADNALGMTGMKIKNASPEILLAAGVVGFVATAVVAAKATLKASDILDEAKETLDTCQREFDTPGTALTEEDKTKTDNIVKVETAKKLIKLYLPTVGLGVASTICVLSSHDILKKRNAALSAAYIAVDGAFKDYRRRAVERFGEEVDKELRFGVKEETVERTEVNEKGKEKKVKDTIKVSDYDGHSDTARLFDEGHRRFNPYNRDANIDYLKLHQTWLNDKLRSKGYLTLNEVYMELEYEPTQAGNVLGWVYKEGNENSNAVDFGIFECMKPTARDFINGYEPSIWLDFNCYPIWDDADIFPRVH